MRLEQIGFIEYNKGKNKLLDAHFNIYNQKKGKVEDLGSNKIADIRSKINNPNTLIHPKESIKQIIEEFKNKKKNK